MSRRDRWIVLFCSLLYVVSQANIALMTLPLKPDVLAFQLTFSSTSFWSIIDAWGSSGVALYRAHMPFDMLHPFIYGTLGVLTVNRTPLFAPFSPKARRFFCLMLPVAGGFDLIENSCHLYLLAQEHSAGTWIIPFSGSCSAIKWALAGLFSIMLILSSVWFLLKFLTTRH